VAKRKKSNMSNTKKSTVCGDYCLTLAADFIKDVLSEVDHDMQLPAMIELAFQATSVVAWLNEEETEIEWLFKQWKEITLSSLKSRPIHWLSELAAIEKRNKAKH